MRNKTTILALAVLLAVGCAKENPTAGEASVTFLVGIQSGEMPTKGVAEVLAGIVPSGSLQLTIRSTTNSQRVYQVTAGQPATIAIDTYQVTGQYTPAAPFICTRGQIYAEPRFSVSTSVAVDGNEDAIAVPVVWDCFAVVRDCSRVASIQATNANASFEELTAWAGNDDYKVAFVTCTSGWDANYALRLLVTPVDGVNYQPTTFRLVTTPVAGSISVRNGYWYEFSPEGVATRSGSLGLTFPEWTEGN